MMEFLKTVTAADSNVLHRDGNKTPTLCPPGGAVVLAAAVTSAAVELSVELRGAASNAFDLTVLALVVAGAAVVVAGTAVVAGSRVVAGAAVVGVAVLLAGAVLLATAVRLAAVVGAGVEVGGTLVAVGVAVLLAGAVLLAAAVLLAVELEVELSGAANNAFDLRAVAAATGAGVAAAPTGVTCQVVSAEACKPAQVTIQQ